MSRVESWFSILLAKVKPYLYSSGGPIIMVQVENEYGSYSACDRDYTARLRDFIRSRLGKDILLFTTDGAGDGYLQCGRIPGCYATVDFGAGTHLEHDGRPFDRSLKVFCIRWQRPASLQTSEPLRDCRSSRQLRVLSGLVRHVGRTSRPRQWRHCRQNPRRNAGHQRVRQHLRLPWWNFVRLPFR